MRSDVQEYDAELLLNISVLEHHLGRNVDDAASTSTYYPQVITQDGYDDDELQEARKSVEMQDVLEVGHQTDRYVSTSPTISEWVRKFLHVMEWFAGNIDGIIQDKDGNIYDVLFKYGDTE